MWANGTLVDSFMNASDVRVHVETNFSVISSAHLAYS